MIQIYKLDPRRECYAYVVDMLCHSGHLNEVEKLMIEISFDLDEIMWMLVGYIKTKNWPKELLISSSICSLEMLLLMSTCLILYATVGQWESLSKEKKAMMDQGVKNYHFIVGLKSNINSYFLRVSSTNQRNQVIYIYILGKTMEQQGHSFTMKMRKSK